MENSQIDEPMALRRLASHLRECAADTKILWFSYKMRNAADELEAHALGLDKSASSH
jgi:hypothetical protein